MRSITIQRKRRPEGSICLVPKGASLSIIVTEVDERGEATTTCRLDAGAVIELRTELDRWLDEQSLMRMGVLPPRTEEPE